MVIILDGNSEHVAHMSRKAGIYKENIVTAVVVN